MMINIAIRRGLAAFALVWPSAMLLGFSTFTIFPRNDRNGARSAFDLTLSCWAREQPNIVLLEQTCQVTVPKWVFFWPD